MPVLDADGFVRNEFQRLAHRRNEEVRSDPWLQIQWVGFSEDSVVVRQIEAGSEDAVRTTLEQMLSSAAVAAHRERKAADQKEAASSREQAQRAEEPAGMQDRFRSFDSE